MEIKDKNINDSGKSDQSKVKRFSLVPFNVPMNPVVLGTSISDMFYGQLTS